MTRYVMRDEFFGATIYDRRELKYQFVGSAALPNMVATIADQGFEIEHWKREGDYHREDILYSPIRVYYELTLKCNLRCRFCYNNSGKARSNELTTEEVIESLRQLRRANVLDMRFTGGEFTQRRDWFDIFSEAKQLGFAVSCNTNGVYGDDSIIEKLASLNLSQITVSVDGKEANHEKHRGRGTFNKTIKTLDALHKNGTSLRINTLISKWSVNDLEEMLELAAQYVSEINFFAFRYSGRATLQTHNSVDYESFYEMARKAVCLREKYPNLNIMHFSQAFRENSIHDDNVFGLKTGAPDGFTRFNILSDGGLWSGGYVPYIDPTRGLGNIKANKLMDVWHNSDKLEEYRFSSQKLKNLCSNCPEYGVRCPGANYEFELYRLMNPATSNPFCHYGEGPSLLTSEFLNQTEVPWK